MCSTAGPASPQAPTAISFSERAPASAPKTATTGPSAGRPKRALPSSRRGAAMRTRDRAPDDAVLPAAAPVHLVREEDAARERRSQAVGEAEMRIRLGQRRRDAAQPRRQHHRAGDEAAAAEHHRRAPAAEDPQAEERRLHGADERAHEPEPGSPREAGDRERVELEARLRHQPRLDAVGCAGERHRHAAVAQRLRYCERGPDVTGRSAGRDHAHELRRLGHSRRC